MAQATNIRIRKYLEDYGAKSLQLETTSDRRYARYVSEVLKASHILTFIFIPPLVEL